MKFYKIFFLLNLFILASCGLDSKQGTLENIQENAIDLKEAYGVEFLEWLDLSVKFKEMSMSAYTFGELHEQFAWERYLFLCKH